MTDYDVVLTSAARLPCADLLQIIDDFWDTVPEEYFQPLFEH